MGRFSLGAFSRSIGVRVMGITITLAMVTYGILFWVDKAWHEETMLEEMSEVTTFVAELLQLAVEEPMTQGNDKGTSHQFMALSRFENVRIYLTDHLGNVTYSTASDALRKPIAALYPSGLLTSLFAKPLVSPVDHLGVVSMDNHPYFVKVETVPNGPSCHHCHGASKPYLGAVVLFYDVSGQIADLRKFNLARSQVLLLCLVGLLVALMLYINHAVIRRLSAIERKAGEVMTGSLDVVFDVGGSDELARLGRHLTEMVGMRRRAEKVLETLNRNLEGVVRERTCELEAKAGELERAYALLTDLDKMKTAFIATVSHELRTPLTSVFGFTRLVRRRLRQKVHPALQAHDPGLLPLAEQMDHDLSVMLDEGERLTSLINNIIVMADLLSGRRDWSVGAVDANRVIDKAVAAVARRAGEKGLALRWTPVALPLVRTDRAGLSQVMGNLLDNAIKFTPQGEVTVRATRQEDTVRIEVADTGPGIRSEDRQAVFGHFIQLGDYMVDKPGGAGLGLAVCKEILSQLGADISLGEPESGGCLVSVTLPLVDS